MLTEDEVQDYLDEIEARIDNDNEDFRVLDTVRDTLAWVLDGGPRPA